ncbi:hypothetical protein predicted by Glimmer/Critica [Sorangium cellulosum So ce56]|uniref:Uncharacterized protein n=1 Tax=Sorangium cellulosum (strain So ce56) TaxID=448385 RepID=A9GK53_SORC5|nr:hypothetical protein predicted by Glimmer/Critica [Sorangium cellulosum So ce56]
MTGRSQADGRSGLSSKPFLVIQMLASLYIEEGWRRGARLALRYPSCTRTSCILTGRMAWSAGDAIASSQTERLDDAPVLVGQCDQFA